MLALWLTYGVFRLFLFYSSFYIELVLHVSPLLTATWDVPLAAGGVTLGLVGGFTLHLLPGRLLLILSGCKSVVCVLLFAIMPEDPSYWAYVLPSMICATIGIDIAFTVSNVKNNNISTSTSSRTCWCSHQQSNISRNQLLVGHGRHRCPSNKRLRAQVQL
ncbi:Efflux pump terJ [Colletotrichum viniferum]|nr:Efflux pump terJ [Colletotrichum viniferum]